MDDFELSDPKPLWQMAVEDFESFLNSSLSEQLASEWVEPTFAEGVAYVNLLEAKPIIPLVELIPTDLNFESHPLPIPTKPHTTHPTHLLPDPFATLQSTQIPPATQLETNLNTLSTTFDRIRTELRHLKHQISRISSDEGHPVPSTSPPPTTDSSSPETIPSNIRSYIKQEIHSAIHEHEFLCEDVIKRQLELDLAQAEASLLDMVEAKLQISSGGVGGGRDVPVRRGKTQLRQKCVVNRHVVCRQEGIDSKLQHSKPEFARSKSKQAAQQRPDYYYARDTVASTIRRKRNQD
ncbi:hypothetical protein HK097_007937 [Rhizophlyctis rosea]|uniref:Uncharacterized protein n=1 Tax=Rhizophlyctis rosea TaxID=64517 RepID=A0AAD5X1Z0_9FUNG|nr:hypothetical protein HK097_007937 [Rhizophlyctis rosea]